MVQNWAVRDVVKICNYDHSAGVYGGCSYFDIFFVVWNNSGGWKGRLGGSTSMMGKEIRRDCLGRL